jgi:phospholipase/carboxylesterase
MAGMSRPDDALLDAVTALVPRLTGSLDELAEFARQFHPPRMRAMVAALGDDDFELVTALDQFRAAPWPAHLGEFRGRLDAAAVLALEARAGLREAAAAPDGRMTAFRALGRYPRAIEALYPIAGSLPSIGRWLLNPAQRDDDELLERLRHPRPDTGVFHEHNERGQRGGFSVYVPEYTDAVTPMPLVMALHGGSGHGRQFLWSWIREARGRGVIVVAPTATGETWSLLNPPVDVDHTERVLARVRDRWSINPERMLLTGMSDGGTFTVVSGLLESSPFTHLAPVAATFDPILIDMSGPDRLTDLPVYLVHGALDWMFPVQIARIANAFLTTAGASVHYREIPDLSHTYPVEENDHIVDWMLAS